MEPTTTTGLSISSEPSLSSTVFPYAPLDPQRAEIRLLTLRPGKEKDHITCTLRTVSLHSKPKFEALSYVWGDASVTRSISVAGLPFQVTSNLDAALRARRSSWKTRVLWVDAICIDQINTEEKNTQVPLMGQIYTTATSVIAWLGPSTEEIELAISWIRTYGAVDLYQDSASAYWWKLDIKARFSARAKREKHLATLRAVEGFMTIFTSPYWTRMWTFQEFRLPLIEPLCMCGNREFLATILLNQRNYEAIATAIATSSDALLSMCNTKSDNPTESEAAIMAALNKAAKATTQQAKMADDIHAGHFERARLDWTIYTKPLLFLLAETSFRKSLDPRDKIYALYGMVPAAQEAYPPDYTKSESDVILETTAYIVNHEEGGARLWTKFGLHDNRLSLGSPPSWLPDFRDVDRNIHPGDPKTVLSDPLWRNDNTPPAKVTDCFTTLHLWARSLGTCRVVLRFAPDWLDVLKQIQSLLSDDSTYLSGSDLRTIVRRPETLSDRIVWTCVDHEARGWSAERNAKTFHELVKIVCDDSNEFISDAFALRSALKTLVGRTFFVTNGGCIGIGLGEVADGDLVIIPPQISKPLVLTKERLLRSGQSSYYQMVGIAYVDGVMGGEWCDLDLVSHIQKQQLEEFLIH